MEELKKGKGRKNYLQRQIIELEAKYLQLSNDLSKTIKEKGICPLVDEIINKRNLLGTNIRLLEKKLNNLISGKTELGNSIGTWQGRISEFD